MKEDKLRKKLRKRAIKLLRFAAENDIEHVSMFADIKDGEPFIHVTASTGGVELIGRCIAEFPSWQEVGR